jgi:nitroreductase
VETRDAIGSRRNVRSYAPQDLDRILEAARRAPSAGNQQAWDFVPGATRTAGQGRAAAGHVAGSAATIALVAPRSDDPQLGDLIQFDLAQATMSIMVAAADLGIGSAHAGVHDQELARRLLGFPRTGLRSADHPRHPADRPLLESRCPAIGPGRNLLFVRPTSQDSADMTTRPLSRSSVAARRPPNSP